MRVAPLLLIASCASSTPNTHPTATDPIASSIASSLTTPTRADRLARANAPAAATTRPTPPVAPAAPLITDVEVVATDVVEMTKSTPLLSAPRADAQKLGVIKKGTRAEVMAVVELADANCGRWLELAPRGWTCDTTTTPTNAAPTTASAPVALDVDDDPSPIGAVYGIVRKGTTAFKSREAAANGEGRAMEGSNTVRSVGSTTVDGVRYWITNRHELVPADRISRITPSTFKGAAIANGQLPAWVRSKSDPYKPVPTYAKPGGRKRGEVEPRTQISVLEESSDGRFVRISDTAWVAKRDVLAPTVAAPPVGTLHAEKWFDIDLDAQVLVAYEGERPVYATLVSTGKYGHQTPTLIARVITKHEATTMSADGEDVYSVADVPWTMFYDGDYALHTAYWHSGFGRPRSHGCINLSPRDAKLLFAWSSPDVPAGWSSVYGSEQHPGSLVRIHSDRMPAPRFRGYAKKLYEARLVASNN